MGGVEEGGEGWWWRVRDRCDVVRRGGDGERWRRRGRCGKGWREGW